MTDHRPTESESRRAQARENIFLSASVRFDSLGTEQSVRIRNISASGMMIDCEMAVAPGEPITADIKNMGKVTGHVAWRTDTRMGIAFDVLVNPKKVRPATSSVPRDPAYTNSALKSRYAGGGRL